MVTLHQVTEFTRKFLAIAAMICIGGLIVFGGVRIFQTVREALFPTPPPPPTVSFGKLPSVNFPTNVSKIAFTYALDTITGTLPNFDDRAAIYKISQPQPSLLAFQNAQDAVSTVGFGKTPTQLTETDYSWTNTEPLPKTITMNVQTKNFTLGSPYINNTTVLAAVNLPDQTKAISQIETYLNNLNSLPEDIDDAKTKISLFAISNGMLSQATSLSTAQVVRVDLFQHDIDKLPIFYPKPSYSTMNFLLTSGETNNAQVVAGEFFYQNISSNHATYPIKTTKQAFEDLKNGNGYIASFDGTNGKVVIRNIQLGYFLNDSPSPYLMPIFVFQGDNNFFAYVSAVTDEWLHN